jgi:ubiquinone/menaquinone biosynthesis C-methylase UbiE
MSSSKDGTAALFSRAAATYNTVGPQHFTFFARRLVEFAGLQPADHVLDIATGTGEVLLAALEQIGKTGRIVGIDLSEAMLQHAASAIQHNHVGNAELRAMDAEQLEFSDESFDVVLCSFGLSSLPNRGRALEGFHRVLRTGGRLGLLDTFGWYFQHDPRWEWQQEVLRSFGATHVGKPVVNDTQVLISAVEDAGFTTIESRDEIYNLVFQDEEEWWRWVWSHGTRSLFEAVPTEKLTELRRQLFLGLKTCQEEDGFIHGLLCATTVRAQCTRG